ncbi:hypothetical protein PV10_01482 [Exophiala mesophila]|uniref:Uncharacterized protein n=1 Tax=Exophiala mesophila TaxID=212818 RepID=A0A0D1ZUW0_EXOME|nr:uncharacterized protein PV10_01482 [Exophiala mesophila]KIV97774.1 hypothetical protein PV10_01482 [Exophiala mesophila]
MRHTRKQDVDAAAPLPPGYVWAADFQEERRSPPTHLTIIFRKTLVFGMPKPDDWDAMDHATQMKSKRDYLCHRWGEDSFTFEEDPVSKRKFHGRIRVEQNNYYATFEDPTFETPNFDEQYRITTRLLENNTKITDDVSFYDFKKALEKAESATAVEVHAPENFLQQEDPAVLLAALLPPASVRQSIPEKQKQTAPATLPVKSNQVFHPLAASLSSKTAGDRSGKRETKAVAPVLDTPAQLHNVPTNIPRSQAAIMERIGVTASTCRLTSNDKAAQNPLEPISNKRKRTMTEMYTHVNASVPTPLPETLEQLPEPPVKKPRTKAYTAPATHPPAPPPRPAPNNLTVAPKHVVPPNRQTPTSSTATVQLPPGGRLNTNMHDVHSASAAPAYGPMGYAPPMHRPSPSLEPRALGSPFQHAGPMAGPDSTPTAAVYSRANQPPSDFAMNTDGVFQTHHRPMPVLATDPQGNFPAYAYSSYAFPTNAYGGFSQRYRQPTSAMVANPQGIFPVCPGFTPATTVSAYSQSPLYHHNSPAPIATSQGWTEPDSTPRLQNPSIAQHRSMGREMMQAPINQNLTSALRPNGQPKPRPHAMNGQGPIDHQDNNDKLQNDRRKFLQGLSQRLFDLSKSKNITFESIIEYVFSLLRPCIGENRYKIDVSSGDHWNCFCTAYTQFCLQLLSKDPQLVARREEVRQTGSKTSELELKQALHKAGLAKWVQAVEATIRKLTAMPSRV